MYSINRKLHHNTLRYNNAVSDYLNLGLVRKLLSILFGSKFFRDLAIEGGEVGLHLFFEYFFVVLEKLFEDIVDEVPDAAGRPVS